MNSTLRRIDPRLYVMMFLQYAVYGLWLPIAARFLSADQATGGLGFSDFQIGMIIAVAGAIGAILAPFIAGQLADRYFAPHRCLAVLLAVGGVISVAYALFCWFGLPHATAKRQPAGKFAFAGAFALLRRRSFAILVGVSLLVSIIHCLYFVQMSKFLAAIGLSDAYIMPAMSLGQFAEIFALALLGPILSRFGFRTVIALGAFCYFLKYAFFGTVGLPLGVIVAAQLIHGFSFAFFFAAGFIYVDRLAPPDVRYSAQTVFMLVVLGLGPLVAGPLNGLLSEWYTSTDGQLDYSMFWYTAAGVGLAATALVAALFRDETIEKN